MPEVGGSWPWVHLTPAGQPPGFPGGQFTFTSKEDLLPPNVVCLVAVRVPIWTVTCRSLCGSLYGQDSYKRDIDLEKETWTNRLATGTIREFGKNTELLSVWGHLGCLIFSKAVRFSRHLARSTFGSSGLTQSFPCCEIITSIIITLHANVILVED